MIKRVVIFAGYNRKSKIEDYVLYYLKGLREVADTLIYVADNAPTTVYYRQLNGLADEIVFEKHGEYDFGSWKRGLRLARKLSLLKNADEVILCNDSCYGPIFPFSRMFAYMEKSHCDFWGITKNCQDIWKHIQSYFLVFRKNVFTSPLFSDFFESITQEKNFWDVVSRYEVGLSRFLIEKGKFNYDIYCPIDSGRHNPCTFGVKLLTAGSPLIKRKIFTIGGFAKDSRILLLSSVPNQKVRKFMYTDYFAFFFTRLIFSVTRFFYQDKTTKSGHRIIKICKIPVLYITTNYDL